MNYEWLKAHKRKVICMLLMVLLLTAMQAFGDYRESRVYLKENGQVVAIQRENLAEAEVIPLLIDIKIDGETKTYEVSLSLQGETAEKEMDEVLTAETADGLKTAIDNLIAALEDEQEQLIKLPQSLSDGKALLWKAPASKPFLLTLLLFPLGVCYLYRSEIDAEKQRKKRMCEQIRRALPGFNDQLLLLLNSGLIFHDAFFRIAENYQQRKKNDAFGRLILDIAQRTEHFGGSIVHAMKGTTGDVALREYSRMVNILADNQYKGVDLRDKLESESEQLWEMRKAMSLQKGKEVETKLSFPLALLLIVLIIIAGVPAMMNM